nr:Os03g0757950 [Ipomoea batatas]
MLLQEIKGRKRMKELLPNAVNYEPDLSQLLHIHDVPPIEHERWLLHAVEDFLEIERSELVPLGENAEPVSVLGCLVSVPRDAHLLHGGGAHRLQQPLADVDGGGFPRVARVFLESESENGYLLARDRVEHRGHDAVHESALLVVIHLNHLFPVVCNFCQTIALTDVNQISTDDSVLWNPMSINVPEGVDRLLPPGGVPPSNKHTVGLKKDLLNCLGCLHWDSRFLDNNLVGLGHIRYHSSSALPVGKISSLARPKASSLGRGVNRNEDYVSF